MELTSSVGIILALGVLTVIALLVRGHVQDIVALRKRVADLEQEVEELETEREPDPNLRAARTTARFFAKLHRGEIDDPFDALVNLRFPQWTDV